MRSVRYVSTQCHICDQSGTCPHSVTCAVSPVRVHTVSHVRSVRYVSTQCHIPDGKLRAPSRLSHVTSGVPRNFVRGGSTNSVEDRGHRGTGSGGGSTLIRGSGGSCNLVQEISFHIVKFSSFLVL